MLIAKSTKSSSIHPIHLFIPPYNHLYDQSRLHCVHGDHHSNTAGSGYGTHHEVLLTVASIYINSHRIVDRIGRYIYCIILTVIVGRQIQASRRMYCIILTVIVGRQIQASRRMYCIILTVIFDRQIQASRRMYCIILTVIFGRQIQASRRMYCIILTVIYKPVDAYIASY